MLDLAIFVAVLMASTAIGYPACLLLPADRFKARFLCAPPMGYALLAVVSTVLYSWGVPTVTSLVAMTAIGLLATVAHVATRPFPRLTPSAAVLAGAVAAVALLCLMPAWIGGEIYTVFQGNAYDQLTYLAATTSFRRFDYTALATLAGDLSLNPVTVRAEWVLRHRPSPPLVLSAFTGLFGSVSVASAYAYLAALQTNMMFAAMFVFANVFNARWASATLLAAALTLGFFQQYVFDINSWGQLACQPIYFLMMAVVALSFQPGRFGADPQRAMLWIAGLFGILLAGAVYLYIEGIAIYGPAGVVAAVVALAVARERQPALAGIAGLSAGSIAALATGLLYYTGTLYFFYNQVTVLAVRGVDWWQYFQRYLFGRAENHLAVLTGQKHGSTLQIADAAFSLPVESIMAGFGLFYLLPTARWPWLIAFAYKLLLYVFVLVLVAGVVRTLAAALRLRQADAGLSMLAACMAGLAMPLVILAGGNFWSAGKGLSMAGPLLFVLLVSPLLMSGLATFAARAASAVVVLAHIGLGIARPVAAADATGGGVLGLPPNQPVIGAQKDGQDWQHSRWAPLLRTCRHVAIDIKAPVFNRLVAIVATDLGSSWSASHQVLLWKPSRGGVRMDLFDSADCLVTMHQLRARDGQRLILLAQDHAVTDYLAGRVAELEIGARRRVGVTDAGLYDPHAWQGAALRWTSGRARFEVANNPARPPRSLLLELWDIALGPARLAVTVDGKVVFDGPLPTRPVEMPLEGLAAGETLTIELAVTPTRRAPRDPRDLGVALKQLRLKR